MEKIGKRSIENIGKKFITLPLSGRILKKGNCMNNLYFVGYVKNKTSTKEKWCDKESWIHLNIREVRRGAKGRARKNNIPFNVSVEYLKDIFPADHLCPVFNCQMSFCNSDKWRSASIDRIDPEIGYVEGNVQWISVKANTIKNNAHPYELLRLANFMVKQYRGRNETKKK